jgi:diguanylate cyclase (GGDEF)-like protein
VVRDLNSTNGTFVNNELKRRQEFKLKQGDLLRIGETIFKFLSGADIESQYHAAIADMALNDGLTSLPNRRQLDTVLAEEVERARRHHRELSLLMIDIDHFKRINDQYGHPAGDIILKNVAGLLRERLRPQDKVGRYGGEEFCAILPETSLTHAAVIADTLRTLVADHAFVVEDQQLRVTVSIGAAAWESLASSVNLYRDADRRLYLAKQLGRNRICAE